MRGVIFFSLLVLLFSCSLPTGEEEGGNVVVPDIPPGYLHGCWSAKFKVNDFANNPIAGVSVSFVINGQDRVYCNFTTANHFETALTDEDRPYNFLTNIETYYDPDQPVAIVFRFYKEGYETAYHSVTRMWPEYEDYYVIVEMQVKEND